jgi:hypothetical protein
VREFLRGLGISLRRPHFAIALWLADAALAAVLVLPVSNFLHAELNRAPAASKMIAAPNYLWWKTARRVHPDLLGNLPEAATALISPDGVKGFQDFFDVQGIGASLLGLGFVAILVHAFLLGGIYGSLHHEDERNLTTFAREGARRLPAFLIVTIVAAAVCVAVYHYLFVGSGAALADYSEDLSTEGASLLLLLARLVLLAAALTIVKISADAIRVALVERPDLPPVTRYFVGIGSALGRLPAILASLVLFSGAAGLLYFLWSRLSVNSAAVTTGGVVLLVAAQQVLIFLKSILKVGYYAAVREAVMRRPLPEAEGPAESGRIPE